MLTESGAPCCPVLVDTVIPSFNKLLSSFSQLSSCMSFISVLSNFDFDLPNPEIKLIALSVAALIGSTFHGVGSATGLFGV